jgi:hypothetical protein
VLGTVLAPACGSELGGPRRDAVDATDLGIGDSGADEPEATVDTADAAFDEPDAAEADDAALADAHEVNAAEDADAGLDATEAPSDTADVKPGGCDDAPDGTPCDDGSACTLGDRCEGGHCAPIEALGCDDDNDCTDDTCLAATGCVHLPNLATCDDGDPCSGGVVGDRCAMGLCRPGPPTCDDDNPCTRDRCEAGTCTHVADDDLPCNDASSCTRGDFCADGVCIGGLADGCAEDDVCVASRCADDGLTCRVDLLDGVTCDDDDACTKNDQCRGGLCRSGTAVDCGFDTECGVFRCDRDTGCILETAFAEGKSCSDSDACTLGDLCDGRGACVATMEAPCDDENPCTSDSCSATWGCSHSWLSGSCDDGNVCTTSDQCITGVCRGAALPCDDRNACTRDSCDPLAGCEFLPFACDDGNPCTVDMCNPDLGCLATPREGPCEDGLACTTGDTCIAGACRPGGVTCDDGDPCTIDHCDAEEGCANFTRAACPAGLVFIDAVGASGAGGGAGLGQWVAMRHDGEPGDPEFALGGWLVVGRACDCEAALGDATLRPGAKVFALRASSPAPADAQIAPGGPTSSDAFDLLFGHPDDGFFLDPTGDVLELVDETGAVIDRLAIP